MSDQSEYERRWQHPWLRLALLIRELTGTRWGTIWSRAKAVRAPYGAVYPLMDGATGDPSAKVGA